VLSLGRHLKLIRVPAVDGNDVERLQSVTHVANRTWEGYMNATRVNTRELALTISHFMAIRQAYLDGYEAALILEDDASGDLIPFWDISVGQLVEYADQYEPDWGVIRLQYTIGSYKRSSLYKLWVGNNTRRLVSNCGGFFGAAAYVVRRAAMKDVVNTFFTEGKYDCLQKRDKTKRCIADRTIFSHFANSVVCAVPPMFTLAVDVPSTGVRCMDDKPGCLKGWQGLHRARYSDDLNWAKEAALSRAQPERNDRISSLA